MRRAPARVTAGRAPLPNKMPPIEPPAGAGPRARSRYYDALFIGAFILIGLVLRISYLNELRLEPDFDAPVLDAHAYDYWARGLVTGEWKLLPDETDPEIRTTPFCRPPGYPYFLAGIYFLTKGSYLAVRLIQMSLGLVNAILMYFLARRFFGRLAGLIGCLLMATCWAFIFYEGELNAPPLIVFLLELLFLLLGQWLDKRSLMLAFLTGVVGGLLSLIRPEVVLFVPVIAAWIAWTCYRSASMRFVVAAGLLALAGSAAMLLPVTIRNYVVSKDLVLICTSGSANFYMCNNEMSDGTWPRLDKQKVFGISTGDVGNNDYPSCVRALRRKLHDDSLSYADVSRYFSRLAFRYIYEHPGRTLELLVKKAFLFWGPIEIGNTKDDYYAKHLSKTLEHLPGFPLYAALFVSGLMAYFLYGGAGLGRENRSLILLMLFYVLFYFCTIIWFLVAERFRVPVMPFLIAFGALALSAFVRGLFGKNRRQSAVLAVTFAAALVFFSINFAGFEPCPARWCFQRGAAYRTKHQPKEAEKELRQAASYAGQWSALEGLSDVLREEGRLEESLEISMRLLFENSNPSVVNYTTTGYVLYKMKRYPEAIAMYEKALAVDDSYLLAHLDLGLALADTGSYERASAEFTRALDDKAQRGHALSNLAWLADLQGKHEEAKRQYEQVIKEYPDVPAARNNLGYILQQEGKPGEARALYESAIQADPTYELAYENLALLLRQQGKADDLERLLRQWLAANPHNQVAERELARMGH